MENFIQSIVFDLRFWNESATRGWLMFRNFHPIRPVEIIENIAGVPVYLKYRILDPNLFDEFINKKFHDPFTNGVQINVGIKTRPSANLA